MVQALLHAGDERGPYLEPQIDVGVHCQSDGFHRLPGSAAAWGGECEHGRSVTVALTDPNPKESTKGPSGTSYVSYL